MNTIEPEEIIEETGIARLPYRFYIPNAKEELKQVCYDAAYQKYGNPLPKLIENRLLEELQAIGKHSLESMYLLPIKLAEKCKELNSMVLPRGCSGNSLILYLGGLTKVNPLPPHYYCHSCKLTEFVTEETCNSGLDFVTPEKEKTCPKCGVNLQGDGNRLDYEFLMGADGSKLPDIEFEIDFSYQQELVSYLQTFIPEDPNLKIANDRFRLRLIDSPEISLLKKLEILTGVPSDDIHPAKVDIPAFCSMGNYDGILSYPELFQTYQPKTFSDLVTIYGIHHGTWRQDEKISLQKAHQGAFVFRDDIMAQLCDADIDKAEAFRISEIVRKGCGAELSEELVQLMLSHHISRERIEDMRNILYLFPKAHVTEFFLIVCKLIWYKTNYPNEFKEAITEEVS